MNTVNMARLSRCAIFLTSPLDSEALNNPLGPECYLHSRYVLLQDPAECIQMCLKDGMKYALAAQKKIYALEGHEAELANLAGQKVTVKGTLKGDTLSVREVTASK